MKQENDEVIQDEVTESKHWQWKKGDDQGNVVTIKDTVGGWINFNEGGRLAVGLKDEFLESLDSDIAENLIPQSANPPPTIPIVKAEPVATLKSPIRILFDKQKKNTKIKLTLEFPVNIPAKGMYEIMSTSFDIDEVKNELKDFILDQLSTTDINNCLNQSVESLIESKYKGE